MDLFVIFALIGIILGVFATPLVFVMVASIMRKDDKK